MHVTTPATIRRGLAAILWAAASLASAGDEPIKLDPSTRDACLTVLRSGLASDEFWPAMHAAEALTLAARSDEVRHALAPRLATETDDQRRCGLARELVRAGDTSRVQIMVDILAAENPYGHVHACESLFKVHQVGDRRLLQQAMADSHAPKKRLMAAAALARSGHRDALTLIRRYLADDDPETARTAAWILARVGDAADLPTLRQGAQRFADPLTRAYFEHALAALGDAAGQAALVNNLSHSDGAVRVYACEFAPEARTLAAGQPLLRLLDDPVLDVRIRAAQALLQLAQPPRRP